MRRQFTTRPTPAMSIFGAIVGVAMLFFAIAFFTKTGAPPAPVAMFLVVWVLVLIGIIVYHVVNATRPGGVPTKIFESSDDGAVESKSIAARLEELESLRSQQLVSDAEYEAKRREILGEL